MPFKKSPSGALPSVPLVGTLTRMVIAAAKRGRIMDTMRRAARARAASIQDLPMVTPGAKRLTHVTIAAKGVALQGKHGKQAADTPRSGVH